MKLGNGHTVVFSLNAPAASNVLLAGDFTQWQRQPIKLKRVSNAEWQAAVELKPGAYEYRFIVDGQWQDDPKSAEQAPNPFGGRNAVRKVI